MYQKYIKRLLDIILSLIAIIITLPIFLITGILVLIFLGKPVIFRQKRPGKKEKIFTMYKFRTMVMEADEKLYRYLEENPEAKKEYKKYKKL